MIVELSKHKDSYSWGRNGGFVPAKAFVDYYAKGVCFEADMVHIEIESGKPGKSSPVKIRLTLADARKLQKAIGQAASVKRVRS
jgi:hypothetical protein